MRWDNLATSAAAAFVPSACTIQSRIAVFVIKKCSNDVRKTVCDVIASRCNEGHPKSMLLSSVVIQFWSKTACHEFINRLFLTTTKKEGLNEGVKKCQKFRSFLLLLLMNCKMPNKMNAISFSGCCSPTCVCGQWQIVSLPEVPCMGGPRGLYPHSYLMLKNKQRWMNDKGTHGCPFYFKEVAVYFI